jgi:hypothetical protein
MASMDKSAPKLRIYCETLPFEDVTRQRTIALLRRHNLEIVLAVRPWQLVELVTVMQILRDSGVLCSVWPMLGDDEGRWASVHNAPSFVRFVQNVADGLDEAGVLPRELLLDLEPPFAHARALAASGRSGGRWFDFAVARPRATSAQAMDAASSELAAAVIDLHARGVATASAVWPLVALDPPGARGWQALLGTPVDALATGRVSVMMYTSILEGWSRGTIRRRDARLLLTAATARAVRRWGASAGMSLGCVGTGALVDEPVYRDPSELAEDAALARAAGCDDLSLFDLGGVLAREPAEAWLDAFAHGADLLEAQATKRVRLVRRLSRLATWALGRRR